MLSEYVPILLHIAVAIGFAASALIISVILGKAANAPRSRTPPTSAACSRRRRATALQREVLSRGDALHPFRPRDRLHVSVGGRLPGVDRREQGDPLEHALLRHVLMVGYVYALKKGALDWKK
jgi:NADH:ubiquinone oxidoreductase subunit 3 (subunit A)